MKSFIGIIIATTVSTNVHAFTTTSPHQQALQLQQQRQTFPLQNSNRRRTLYSTKLDKEQKAINEDLIKNDMPAMEPLSLPIEEKEPKIEGVVEGLAWRGVVAILCALWASNFAAAKVIMAEPNVDSALYALTRFSVAALALLPGSINAIRRGAIDKETALGAVTCGAWVAFGYLGQTLGLLSTTASKSCVICSMHCVFVAVVAEYMRNQTARQAGRTDSEFDTKRLLPAAVAVAGVAIIELQGAAGDPTIGDLFSFAQPIGFGLGYLQLEELMRSRPQAALPVSAIKLAVVATASLFFFELSPFLLHGEAIFPPRGIPDFTPIISSPAALGGILYTGLITTALALWVESIAFKRVPATDASIILTTEPLFAAGAGALALGETFGLSDYVGASLIIGACILAIFLEEEAVDEQCDPYVDADCVPPRTWPEGFE